MAAPPRAGTLPVSVASASPFHIYDLARQMHRLGQLRRLYTAYPRWRVSGLPAERVRTFPWVMLPKVAVDHLGWTAVGQPLNRAVIETFDRWLAARLEPCAVFHCLSSFGVRARQVARQRHGALTVCDRGSTHILTQQTLLRDEYARWGLRREPVDPYVLDRELADYEAADLITVPSTFAYRSFLEQGVPAAKLARVPYGVDLSMFHPVPKRDSTFRVVYVGALSLQKGLPYLLEAFARLRLTGAELWLIGPETEEARPLLERYEGVYDYLGRKPRHELYDYYSQGSVFVLASVQEGLALVMAQALACGLPVVATTNTGAEDLITDGVEGFIVPIRDSGAIAEKLQYLYENPAVRDAMSQAALERPHQLGGWDDYGDQMLETYARALSARDGPGNA